MRIEITKPKASKILGVVKASQELEKKVTAEIKKSDPANAKQILEDNVVKETKADTNNDKESSK